MCWEFGTGRFIITSSDVDEFWAIIFCRFCVDPLEREFCVLAFLRG